MVIQKVKELNGVFNAEFLMGRYGINNFMQVGNKYVAIKTRQNRKIMAYESIIVREICEKPLWEQHMELNMGRVPKPVVKQHNYRTRELEDIEIQRNRFEVYEEI